MVFVERATDENVFPATRVATAVPAAAGHNRVEVSVVIGIPEAEEPKGAREVLLWVVVEVLQAEDEHLISREQAGPEPASPKGVAVAAGGGEALRGPEASTGRRKSLCGTPCSFRKALTKV